MTSPLATTVLPSVSMNLLLVGDSFKCYSPRWNSLPFQGWLLLSYGANIPHSCLSVCPSAITDHTGLSCFVAIFRNAIMSNYVSFCLCFWITVNLYQVFFYLWTAIPFFTTAALTSIPTRVLLLSSLADTGCLFNFYSAILKCVTWCPVSRLLFLVFQLSVSFLVPCVYFLEEWLLQSLLVWRTVLLTAGFRDVF